MKILHPSRQRGLSLVELMVAIVLGLLLIGGVLQIFLSSNKTYKTNLALSEVQEAGRFAMEFLTFDIRNASYRGECVGSLNELPDTSLKKKIKLNEDDRYQLAPGLKGWDSTKKDNELPDWFTQKRLPGTDIILLKHAARPTEIKITHPPTPEIKTIKTSAATNILTGELLLISEPVGCDIFQNNSAPATASLSTSESFRYNYSLKSEVLKYNSSLYYISNSNNGIPSLWRIDYSNPDASSFEPEELVQGVQDMQIKYALGDDTGKITEDYVDAKDDLDWSRVVAVRVNLVSISHEKNIVPPGQEPQLNSAFKAIEDGRIGQVFSTTVGIRNRLP
ncbi:hypothetical protein GCM10009425_04520 [Pseudomonas asuensis]|uniref:Type IV pilus assembly protein PilW n=1 Tax=Pseudomonas asuensis TaxID=1825787 RepID=A0ABQ2GIR3_9PSED|nr:PilW family protein [Pseudomonas asuensis]GGL96623.1 hypothetical protein GCM10009425_04520 [Pseudomonas asuensis]